MSERIRLTKSLGQNFLHDGNQLRRIVAAGEITPGDQVLEIGPGLGPLTELLLETGASVLAIEIDVRLHEYLRRRFAGKPNLTVLNIDALAHLKEQSHDWSGWKLVANLPYSVASPILVELAQSHDNPMRMVATLQIEVARKIVAAPGTDDYGLLSLLLQVTYEPLGWFRIPAGCFFPPPEVDSACVTLIRRQKPLLPQSDLEFFRKIVKRAFSQRRKMMLKLLKEDWQVDRLEHAFLQTALAFETRAEKVSVEQFAQLTRLLRHGNDQSNDR
jgi:16S rRNA (adenine1518-N6/adenine1519-N6)-dimethyltransferase